MLEFFHVTKTYDGVTAVDDVSFSAEEGAFLALIGESGSGKSTLLRLINRLIKPSSGTVQIAGEDVAGLDGPTLRRSVGFMPQGAGLFPHMSVAGNVGAGMRLAKWEPARISARVSELLDIVRLPQAVFGERRPSELSGGQRQRVAFARAIATGAKLVLLDEPFSALDPETRLSLQDDLRALHAELGLTTVMVTHGMAEAITLADRVLVMREGRLIQNASPAAIARAPADDGVKALIETPAREARAIAAVLDGPL